VVLPRTREQRAELTRAGGFVVPERAVDAQSLVALADVVVSAGGTMNREAVALGTPVWTTFEGRLGAVDEHLIASGRLRRLTRADEVEVVKRRPGAAADPGAERVRRDPEAFTDLLTDGLASSA
jgi:predicted glycosyltransferase